MNNHNLEVPIKEKSLATLSQENKMPVNWKIFTLEHCI